MFPQVGLAEYEMADFCEGKRIWHKREIKGVTLHGLAVERIGDEWLGRVIFDV